MTYWIGTAADGHGYMTIFPRAAYNTRKSRTFDGQSIVADYQVPWSFDAHGLGRDNQLDVAIRMLSES